MKLKRRVHEILEPAGAGDRESRAFDVFMLTLIVLNIVALTLESDRAIYVQARAFFDAFETISVGVFTIEYLLRIWSCPANPRYASPVTGRLRFALTPLALFDLLAILPFYLPLLGVDLRVMRVLRFLRLFRIAKLVRYSRALQVFGRVFHSKREELMLTLVFIAILMLISSSLMYFAEREAQPDKFSSIPAAMWWAVATLTTVGYGDVYPVTALGRCVAAIIAVLGIGLFALPAGVLGAAFLDELQQKREGTTCCPHCGKELPAAENIGRMQKSEEG